MAKNEETSCTGQRLSFDLRDDIAQNSDMPNNPVLHSLPEFCLRPGGEAGSLE